VFHITDANGEAEAVWRLSNTLGRDTLVVTLLGTGQPAIIVDARVGDLSSTPPTIVAFGPANGAANLNAGSAVSVKFSKGMNPGSATAGVKLFANGNPVTGSTTLQLNQTYVLIQPDQLLPFAARCSLDVQTGVLDVNGLPLAAGAFSVFTVQQPPTLALTSINPPAGSTGIPVVIDGVGFSTVPAQNSVLFNGTPAVVSSATATSIVATVPLTATSGTVTVQVGAGSATLNYTVLTGGGVGGSVANIGVTQGSRKIAVTSDGKRAYVTNPGSNTVQALDVANLTTLADITVGLQPSGIGLVNDTRAYVANQGSDDVSVIDIDPSSPDYHKVVAIIPVGDEPVDLAVTALGPEVLVVNHSSKTVSFIDANPGNGTYNQVITQTNTGSRGGGGIAITPDGGRAYVITDAGDLIEIDLHTNAVITQSNTGSRGGSGVAITPDGTLALVLLNDGTLLVIDIVPNSSNHNGVITQTNTGSKGGGGVAISPDGGRAYVTSADGNVTLVFTITASNGAGQIVIVPGPAVTLTLESTIAVGQAPLGVVVDPGGKYVLVVNSGSGTVTLIGSPNSLPPVPATFDFNPNTLNLKSNGKWVTGFIEPSDPFTAQQIVVSSIRLNGVVAVDSSGPVAIGDHDGNGKQDLAVKFSRNAVSLILPSGDKVPVTVTGIVDTRTFIATDSIKVKLGKVTAPVANSIVPPGHATTVRWETPSGIQVQWVAVLHSFDRGETWTLDATHQPNTGQYQWTAPTQQGDSVKVAVMQVESADTSGTLVEGTLGVSGFFRIFGPTDVEPAPAVLSFLPAHPNPASGGVRMRFGLPRRTDVTLELYDLMGRRVTTLAAGEHEAGWHDVAWTGRSRDGSVAHAGVYFVRFRAEGREFKQRLVWLR
jgi:YVTN family beta-propeller protein